MLQVSGDGIRELQTMNTLNVQTTYGGGAGGSMAQDYCGNCVPYQTVWYGSYPVYVCTDKTKKAIEVLKALQAEKLLKCESVPRFIELVEKISNLL